MNAGDRIIVTDRANLPCNVGDIGYITKVEPTRLFPIGVKLEGANWIEWFAPEQLQLDQVATWMVGLCDDEQEAA